MCNQINSKNGRPKRQINSLRECISEGLRINERISREIPNGRNNPLQSCVLCRNCESWILSSQSRDPNSRMISGLRIEGQGGVPDPRIPRLIEEMIEEIRSGRR